MKRIRLEIVWHCGHIQKIIYKTVEEAFNSINYRRDAFTGTNHKKIPEKYIVYKRTFFMLWSEIITIHKYKEEVV